MQQTTLASTEAVNKAIEALKANGLDALVVENKEAALLKIKEMIPAGSTVMNGSSRTLEEIGFIDYLKSDQHGWNNLHAGIVAEKDPAIQAKLRKEAMSADYFLVSVHAATEEGELLIASNTGSQLPNIVFGSRNVIFVVGTQKIVSNSEEAIVRLAEEVMPQEDERMKGVYGVGTKANKVLLVKGENPMMGRKLTVIFVNEKLGF